jgi:Oligosaccharide biosynthesis protein Alg14 like
MHEPWPPGADRVALPDTSTTVAEGGYSLAQHRQNGGGGSGVTILDRGAPETAAPADVDDALPAVLDLLLVCSSGGHLAQLAALSPWMSRHRRHWVCFDTPDAVSVLRDERVTWAHHPTTRNLANLLRNFVLAWALLARERPDVVLSTGAGTALPFFVVARLRGIPTVYLEVYDRMDTPTLTGRLCRPFTDRMLVQWDEQARLYRGAEVVGVVL